MKLTQNCLALVVFFPVGAVVAAPPAEVSLKGLPSFALGEPGFKADPYIEAAGKLRAAGKDRAVEILRAAAKDPKQGEYTVIVLCRMLFAAKPKNQFRAPSLGQPSFAGCADAKDWPLEPIEIIDGVPFVVVWGYSLAGLPESERQYLAYCLEECDWGTAEFKPKTAEEKKKALAKLLASPKWKEPLPDFYKDFLSAQVK